MASKDKQKMTRNEPEELKAEELLIRTNASMLKEMKDMAEPDPEFAKTLGHFELHDNTKQQEAYLAKQEAKKRICASSRSDKAGMAKVTKEWLKALSLDNEADEKATPSAKTKAKTKIHAKKDKGGTSSSRSGDEGA
ncbi:hypothetical protein ABVK25_007587 [Lepraria finkii]|uniref:Uncharacterized protein n=1 Tax=Lepraria finkii TaxID=1340010 RepID=A0ABR4B2K7_9LECA